MPLALPVGKYKMAKISINDKVVYQSMIDDYIIYNEKLNDEVHKENGWMVKLRMNQFNKDWNK